MTGGQPASHKPRQNFPWKPGVLALLLVLSAGLCEAAPPPPPLGINVEDRWFDNGTALVVTVQFPAGNTLGGVEYVLEKSGEPDGLFTEVERAAPYPLQGLIGRMSFFAGDLVRGEPYWFRVSAVNAAGDRSASIITPANSPARPTRQLFDRNQRWLLVEAVVICGSIILFIILARFGMPLNIRKIAGLEAVEEAVGRATEMGRSCLFVPGIQDMNEMQTIAGLTILARVAEQAAAYDCRLETPTSRSLVMTAARETVENAYLTAGRPEAYNEDDIYYVTDEQFAYVSFITGKMVREKPAACFYLGSFYAESLILAETGNAIGAIQVAGTAQPSQLPFFVAACDYTLIGEEFFAASAYLSRNPDQLGSLKGQDVGKIIVAALVLFGVISLTLGSATNKPELAWPGKYIKEVVLKAAG